VLAVSPLVAIDVGVRGRPRALLLKLENRSPSGSIKGRTARSLVDALEVQGRLSAGATLVESTSGNLGVGLAVEAAARGYRFHAVVDPKVPRRALMRMRRLGATVEIVTDADENGTYLAARLARVRELSISSDRLVWTDQYENPANPRAHETGTGPELLAQAGQIDAVFAAVSTGGTVAGLARFFRIASPRTRVVAVDTLGSAVFGGPPGPRVLTGIGSAQRSRFLTVDLVSDVTVVDEAAAVATCRNLARRTGLRVGGSSGAVIAAASRYLSTNPQIRRAVCLCADGGENYLDTIYDDTWLERHGIVGGGGAQPSGWVAAS
jgi:2,3-diaminopropionate biosynthesis protein SbnA